MPRRVHLPVVDLPRRYVLRGMAAALVAGLAGCRIPLEDPEPPAGAGSGPSPDAGASAGSDVPPPSGPAFERCGPSLCLDLAHPDNAALRSVDGAKLVVFENRRLLVIRLTEDSFLALSAVCTHTGCTVRYSALREQVECPCHGSTFDLGGGVTRGPATAPLAQFATAFDAAAQTVTVALA
ncbi:MAG: Rieske (2Fe-2S) protein [Myxococcales bacterium]|nr:Rieske (2Fe-2S) protein [Myxococcales bacterium]